MLSTRSHRIGLGLAVVLVPALLPLAAATAAGDTATLEGHVSGVGLPVGQVNVWGWDGDSHEFNVDVTSDGRYRATGLAPGDAEVHIGYDGGEANDYVGLALLTAGEKATVDIPFTVVEGTVTGDGNPLSGISVSSETLDYGDQVDVVTGADGSYLMLVVADSMEHVIAVSPQKGWLGQYFDNETAREDATPVSFDRTSTDVADFDLLRTAVIKGHINLPKGATRTDAAVQLYDWGTGELVTTTAARRAGAHRGDFRLSGFGEDAYALSFGRASGPALAPGSYYRNVIEDRLSEASQPISLTFGWTRVTETVTARPKAGGAIAGKIYKVVHGRKVGRGKLRIVAVPVAGTGAGVTPIDLLSTRSTVTARTGKFTVTGLAPGRYRVFVWNSSHPFPGMKRYHEARIGTRKVTAGRTAKIGAHRFDAPFRN